MAISSQFRTIYSADILEAEVVALLQLWFPTYLREMERQHDLQPNSIKTPITYTTRRIFDALPGEELPKCVVVSPGLAGKPEKRGGGSYDCLWRLGVGVAFSWVTEEEANTLVKNYAAASRAIMLQQLPHIITWEDESYDDLPITDKLVQYKAASNFFTILVQNVVSKTGGPTEPDLLPDDYDHAIVETVVIDLQKQEVA